MNNELRMLINNLTQDIIDLYNIRIPIENINNVVMTLGGSVEESIDIDPLSSYILFWALTMPLQTHLLGIPLTNHQICNKLHFFVYSINPNLFYIPYAKINVPIHVL